MIKLILRKLLILYKRLIRIIRTWALQNILAECGKGLLVFGRVRINGPEHIYIGNHCALNEGVLLLGRAPLRIEDNVVISPYVTISTIALDYTDKTPPYSHHEMPVAIKKGAWIGAGAKILPGVTIGENSVIAAGSVVTKSIPANSMAAGVPAVVKKTI